jgi:hypothetical protein
MQSACILLVLVSLLGCEQDELPPLDHRGERVRVGTNKVDQVCAGTMRQIDREVERVEDRLDLPRQATWIDMYIVDSDTVEAYCGRATNCARSPADGPPRVMVTPSAFEGIMSHELVHARVPTRSMPLFEEGIAEAASRPRCPALALDVDLAAALTTKSSLEWPNVRGTYYAAGELVAWLIEEHGPRRVLAFMTDTNKGSTPETVHEKYIEHFGSEISTDFLANFRTRAELDALVVETYGCGAAVDISDGPVQLVADLDCDSERVHNNFGLVGSGYVEWSLRVEHEQTFALSDELPPGTGLTIQLCGCTPRTGSSKDWDRLARPFDETETLQPGTYRLRWFGPLDEGLSLDVELVPTL